MFSARVPLVRTNLYEIEWLLNVCCLGIAELLIFHPVDTIAKRLMSNKAKVRYLRL